MKTRYVLALSGLNMRESPDPAGKMVVTVPYGSAVEMIEATAKQLTVENIRGRWIKARASGKEGYVFDGFLGRLPAPDTRKQMTLADYADAKLGKAGKASKSGASVTQKYTHDVEIVTTSGEGFSQTEMRVKGISVAEGYLLVRAIAVSGDWWFSKNDIFPAKAGKYTEKYKTRDGQSFTLEVTVEMKKDARGEITDLNITKNSDGYQRVTRVYRKDPGTVVIVMAVAD